MELFARDHILGVLDASTQEDVFNALADSVIRLGIATDAAAIVADYQEREKEASTGFGGGVAIPHSKTDNVSEATLLFARLSNGVEWNALDGAPVTTVISILVPTSSNDVHLQLLSRFARKLVHPEFVDILTKGDFDEVYSAITSAIG